MKGAAYETSERFKCFKEQLKSTPEAEEEDEGNKEKK